MNDTSSKLQVIAGSAANSLNAVAGLLNHKGMANQAAVLLSAQKVIYELMEAVEMDSRQINPAMLTVNEVPAALRVETPLGTIVATKATDPEHPGVWIDLVRPGSELEMPLGLVEYSADDADFSEGEKHLITRVWGDALQEEYTERVVHERIEDYFKTDEATSEKGERR